MSKQSNNPDNPVARLMITTAIGWALWKWSLSTLYDPMLRGLWWFGALCVGVGIAKSIPNITATLREIRNLLRAFGKDDSKGSAGFMSQREIRKEKLHRRKTGSRFAGIVGKTALWLWTETHHLIIGPSGSQKTTAAIINILMGSSESALITDIKGELWITTREHRAKIFGHETLKVDPKDPDNSIHINPLDDIALEVEKDDPAALSRIRGIALQLLPDPKGGGGQNDVFYRGGRDLIVAVALAVIVVMPPTYRHLSMVYRILCDLDLLHDLLDKASGSAAMRGEIADMARSQHAMFFGDNTSNANTAKNFRVNAAQALEAFGPGNYLARITSDSTFHLRELKKRKISVYLMIDYANSEVLGSFMGLLQHLAADAMVEDGTNKPVLFCFDEFTNAPMRKLCKVLTLLRSAGVRVVMATQDLNEIERVYSKEDLETVLSETPIKQFLLIRSKKTLEWLSSYLGEYTTTVSSFAMGREGTQESLARANRRLQSEDELRRLPADAQIIIYDNQKPILAKKVQTFAIAPWRKTLGINTGYSTKRNLLPVEVRMHWWGTRITAHGTRLYRKMESKVLVPKRSSRRLVSSVLAKLVPITGLIIVAACLLTLTYVGLPNLRWEYAYRSSAQDVPVSYVWCRYIGPTSPGVTSGPYCPLILWRKR